MRNNIGDARRSYANTLENGTFTQDDAAAYFNVAPSTYKKWEQGQGKLNGEILCAIASKYNCSIEYLLCRTDTPEFEELRGHAPARVSPSDALTADERELLSLYRSLDDTSRQMALRAVRGMASVSAQAKNQADNAETA